MASIHWEPERVKSQLRAAAQSLGALLEKKDAASREQRQHIVHLLLQNDVDGARMQTRRVMHEDGVGDVYELLGSYCGGLLDRLGELTTTRLTPDSPIYESVCALIYSAPRTDCPELRALRDNLLQHYGASFAVAIADAPQACVPDIIVRALDDRIPPRQEMDDYLARIALASGLDWHPPLSSRDKLMWLAALFDENAPQLVDLNILRRVAAQGLVEDPPWVRPLSWRLMLNTLPADRAQWQEHNSRKRDEYYDLARRLLSRLKGLPPPGSPLSAQDQSLLSISRALPGMLPESLEHPVQSPLNPLDPSAPEDVRIDCADEVDKRAWMIVNRHSKPQPEIQVNGDATDIPQISLTTPPVTEASPSTPILRLLYIYTCLHPSTSPSHLPSILIPIYATLAQTTDDVDVCHVEADSFWLLEEVSAEFSDLWTDEGCDRWRAAIAQRLSWADPELLTALDGHGLSPALPHYSFRWLTPILSSTFPLAATCLLWDSLFTCPMIQTGNMPKIEYLVDICAAMLVKQRTRLLRLCPGQAAPASLDTPDPEAMMQAIHLMQSYPLSETGIENIIDFALHIAMRRCSGMLSDPSQPATAAKGATATIGKTLRDTVLKLGRPSLSAHDSETETEDESPVEHHAKEPPAQNGTGVGLGSRLWKGLTAPSLQPVQESAGAEEEGDNAKTPNARTFGLTASVWKTFTTPRAASSSAPSDTASEPRTSTDSSQTAVSSLWSYAERLRDSDTAASLAKAGTNWRIKAVDALTSRTGPGKPQEGHARASSLSAWRRRDSYGWSEDHDDFQRNSYPLGRDYADYVPPPRPKFFKPSVTPPGIASPPPMSPKTTSSGLPSPESMSRAQSIQAAFAALTNSTPKKTGPRPLRLNANSLITPPTNSARSRSPTPSGDRWAHVRRSGDSQPRGSQRSSVSSVSTSLQSPIVRSSSPAPMSEPDGGRFVPLRRSGGYPARMSVTSESEAEYGVRRTTQSQRSSLQSTVTVPEPAAAGSDSSPPPSRSRGWEMVSMPDSPPDVTPMPTPAAAPPTIPAPAPAPAPPPVHKPVTLHDRAVTLPATIAEDEPIAPLHHHGASTTEPDPFMSDGAGARQTSIRRAPAVSSRRRSEDAQVVRADSIPETSVLLQKAPRVRSKRYLHKTTPSMQHVPQVVDEPAAAATDTTDSERDRTPKRTHSRKGSALSLHTRKDSASGLRKDAGALSSPRSPRAPAPPAKPKRRPTEAGEADDELENYADILLAYGED